MEADAEPGPIRRPAEPSTIEFAVAAVAAR
jgi:hypothetical protein